MLKILNIKNYALIEDLEVRFDKGFNILTGETGAGKSILIGALGTILGDRVDTNVLRSGSNKAIIEGIFDISNNKTLIEFTSEQDLYSNDNLLILRREINDNGRSRAFVNDTPVQLSMLQQIGDFLVDLHGQHEHQSLLQVQNHLKFLDLVGGIDDEVKHIGDLYNRLKALSNELEKLQKKQQSLQEKKEYLSFQLEEINKINPLPEEETELLNEEKLIQHGEKLHNLTSELINLLYDQDYSVYDQLNSAQIKLNELAEIDNTFKQSEDDCNSAIVLIEELAKMCQAYNAKLEFSPEKLESIQARLTELSGLKKKYNRNIEELVEYRKEIQNELHGFENLSVEHDRLKQEINALKTSFTAACSQLSEKRKDVAQKLSSLIPDVLSNLGMPGSRFNVGIEYQLDPFGDVSFQGQTYKAGHSGMDFVEFGISTNAGGEIRPLTKVASGGEISRIMLALKSILAQQGQTPVLIFDEIDNGVSGRMATAVGKKLRDLSRFHQVICITHLPQIASMGNSHYLVEKIQMQSKSATSIRKLSQAERTEAIAKLLAGENISETHLRSAQELLEESLELVKE